MKTAPMTLHEIRSKGFAALLRELGPEGYVQFLRQFIPGHGDYTAQRQPWADSLSASDIRRLLAQHRSKTPRPPRRKKGK